MLFLGKLVRFIGPAGLALLLVAAAGCLPDDTGRVDEEREPHYVLGKSRVNAQDYPGAIEAFQQALEANPRSAAAHFQLACLYDSKVSDPAAAIYHFQEYLRLNPQAGNQDVIRQSIYSCKQQLAADVLPLPSAPAAEKQLESLMQQNRVLQQQLDHLNDELRQWNAYYASQQAAARNQPVAAPTPVSESTTSTRSTTPVPAGAYPRAGGSGLPVTPLPAPPVHTHKVQPGETMASIARKAGLTPEAIESANPGVNPRRLRAGQVLNLPPS